MPNIIFYRTKIKVSTVQGGCYSILTKSAIGFGIILIDLIEPVKPSIVFLNTYYVTEAPRPFPPNVIQVGGIHLQPPEDDIIPAVSYTRSILY